MENTSQYLLIKYTLERKSLLQKLNTFTNIIENEGDEFTVFLAVTKPDIDQVLDNIGKLGDEFNTIAENMFGMFENDSWDTIQSKLSVFSDVCNRYEKALDKYIGYYEDYINV